MNNNLSKQIANEQKIVDKIFNEFDLKYKNIYEKLKNLVLNKEIESFEKEDFILHYEKDLVRLETAENRLVFGKIHTEEEGELQDYYIGRIGIHRDSQNLLLDWRSEVGSKFYRASISDNQNVVLRRHIYLDGREVTSLDDEVLDNSKIDENAVIIGDGALLKALDTKRTGFMNDIVATIQSKQDEIIRIPYNQCLIIQGTPGTGKTVVALHRIAYLLYQYQAQLSADPVLFIGPSKRFITYVSNVLPMLGETGVEHKTIDSFLMGLHEIEEIRYASDQEQKIKGAKCMQNVLKVALDDFIDMPKNAIRIHTPSASYTITPQMVKTLQDNAKKVRKNYNQARELFIKNLLNKLVENKSKSPEIISSLKQQLSEFKTFIKIVNTFWVPINAKMMIKMLFSNEKRLKLAFHRTVTEEDFRLLKQFCDTQSYKISNADLPLIDYADYLINGNIAKQTIVNQDLIDEAEDILENYAWKSQGSVDAKELAMRFENIYTHNTDYLQKYSHICVDEAQELSFMQWKVLKRRQDFDSWTIVGDTLQTFSLAGTKNWRDLSELFNNIEYSELNINYRNPREVAEYANSVASKSGLQIPQNIEYPRSSQNSIVKMKLRAFEEDYNEITNELFKIANDYSKNGLTVIISDDDTLNEALKRKIISNDSDFEVLKAYDTKGLEFDNVIVYNQDEIAKNSASNLFVALTRATQKLILI